MRWRGVLRALIGLVLLAVIFSAACAGNSPAVDDACDIDSEVAMGESGETDGDSQSDPADESEGEPPGEPGEPAVVSQVAEGLQTVECTGMAPESFGISDEDLVGFLKNSLAEAIPVDFAPKPFVSGPVYLRFELDGGQVVDRCEFRYDRLYRDTGPGYVHFPEGWYQVSADFYRVLDAVSSYPEADLIIAEADRTLLAEYGWTPYLLLNSVTVQLPERFLHRAGEFPAAIYWAHSNELNKDAGFDLTPYLGQMVEVRIYKVLELMPESMNPYRGRGRAIVVRQGEALIGAWLDANAFFSFTCSLQRRSLETVTGKTWEEWVVGVVDAQDPLEQQLASLTPEEIIRTHYEAIDAGNYRIARACLTRKKLAQYLFMNKRGPRLYNPDFAASDPSFGEYQNILSVKVLSIEERADVASRLYSTETKLYYVDFDMEIKQGWAEMAGARFISLIREIPGIGWRIRGIGSGP